MPGTRRRACSPWSSSGLASAARTAFKWRDGARFRRGPDADRPLLVGGRGLGCSSRSEGPTSRLAGCSWPWGPASPFGSHAPWPWKPAIGRRSDRPGRPPRRQPAEQRGRAYRPRDRLALCPGHDRAGPRIRRAMLGRVEISPVAARFRRSRGSSANHCTGVTWERDTIHNFMLRALVQMGEIAELKQRWSVFSSASRTSAATCTPPPCSTRFT